MLGALEGYLAWVEPRIADHRHECRGLEARVEQAGRGDVHGQPDRREPGGAALLGQRSGTCQDGADEEDVELDRASCVDRRLDDRCDRLRKHRHDRSEEALVLMERTRVEFDDRLVGDPVQVAQAEEVVERLGLDDGGGLGHADPIGQAGCLDGCRECHQIAVRLGQRGVDRHHPVARLVRVDGDIVSQGFGQQSCRGDEDGTGVELEDTGILQLGREPAHEAGVARPEQALIGEAARWREQSQASGSSSMRRRSPGHRRGPYTGPHLMLPCLSRARGRPRVRGDPVPWSHRRTADRSLDGRSAMRQRNRSPAWIGMSSLFSGGASGHAQRGSNAQDGWVAKFASRMSRPVVASTPRSAPFAASTR